MNNKIAKDNLVGKRVRIISEEDMFHAYKTGLIVACVKTRRKGIKTDGKYMYKKEYIVQFQNPMEWSSFYIGEMEILK